MTCNIRNNGNIRNNFNIRNTVTTCYRQVTELLQGVCGVILFVISTTCKEWHIQCNARVKELVL